MKRPIIPGIRQIDAREASLVDLVESTLEEAILSHNLPEGTSLAESDLAETLGVSRSPVRDALKRLSHKGLVEIRLRRGVAVATFTPEQIGDFFHLREALEGLAARLAADRMPEDEIRDVRAHLDRVAQDLAKGGSPGYPSADDDFHARVLRGARSQQLERAMDIIQARVRLLRRRSGAMGQRARLALAEHRAILEAIAARDPETAEAGMRQHIRNARENLLRENLLQKSEE